MPRVSRIDKAQAQAQAQAQTQAHVQRYNAAYTCKTSLRLHVLGNTKSVHNRRSGNELCRIISALVPENTILVFATLSAANIVTLQLYGSNCPGDAAWVT
ncbi:hypothetical protein PT974_08313 [Cladobotryum mycophilum]|uniref:Uncharacterized protein n=1 Tax=Cladobotryum mycophilum TaxID=491253 RepID=A0ABR0SE53_9HYPO